MEHYFRYTEYKIQKYNGVEYHLSKDLSVKEYLAILSKFTSKTNIYEKYKDYTDCKNKTFNHIYIHYCSELSYNRNNENEMTLKKIRG